MPVVALSEVGLIVDVFGQKPKVIKSTKYQMANKKIISYFNGIVKFIAVSSNEESPAKILGEFSIEKVAEMKLSENGKFAGFITNSSKLVVIEVDWDSSESIIHKVLFEADDIEFFNISNRFITFYNQSKIQIWDFSEKKSVFEKSVKIKDSVCMNSVVFILTEKVPGFNPVLYAFRNGKIEKMVNFDEALSIKAEYKKGGSESEIVLIVETSYSGKTYFSDVSVYFLTFDIKNSDFQNEEINNAPEGSEMPKNLVYKELISKTEEYYLFVYKNIYRVLQVKFLEDSFFICFGSQPSNLYLFDGKTGSFIKKFRRIIRNKVDFTQNLTRGLYAGFGNLPGNIEVHVGNETACKFEVLGASVFSWMPDNTRFIVAITNYFKSDNRVDVYDYYGRLLEQMECKSLLKAEVYGESEPEKILEAPLIKNISKKEEAFELPKFEASEITGSVIKIQKKKRVQQKGTVSKDSVTKEDLLKKLEIAKNLKERMQRGEDLSVGDLNIVFEINDLKDQIEKFK